MDSSENLVWYSETDCKKVLFRGTAIRRVSGNKKYTFVSLSILKIRVLNRVGSFFFGSGSGSGRVKVLEFRVIFGFFRVRFGFSATHF